MTLTAPNSVLLYDGPSRLDGAPIICILSGLSIIAHGQRTRWLNEPRLGAGVRWISEHERASLRKDGFNHGFR